MILQARTVFLPKPHKVKDNKLQPADARPITICAAWWRLFASAWLHNSRTEAWIRHVLHEDVCYGKGNDAQIAAAKLLHTYTKQGFLASLDYQKCYDLLRPMASVAMLRQTGFPEEMCKLCEEMWVKLRRWTRWGQHVDSESMGSFELALPQGDPFGPLLCGLWLSSGIRWVTARRRAAQVQSVVFIDDRTFSTPTAQGLVEEIESWQLWSGLVGLKESTGKAQVVAKTAKQKIDLDSVRLVDIQQTDATFLGVTTRGKPRKSSAKESERNENLRVALNLLSTLKLPYAVFTRYARIFGVSLVSYGWLAKLPTLGETKKTVVHHQKGSEDWPDG